MLLTLVLVANFRPLYKKKVLVNRLRQPGSLGRASTGDDRTCASPEGPGLRSGVYGLGSGLLFGFGLRGCGAGFNYLIEVLKLLLLSLGARFKRSSASGACHK